MRVYYIHGFLSGPQAAKAHKLKDFINNHPQICKGVEFNAPDFADTPVEAYNYLVDFFAQELAKFGKEQICLVGSSMGGFFSSLLSNRYGFKAVLLNPCVHPQDYFINLIGPQYNETTDRHFELTPDMLPFLQKLDKTVKADPELFRIYLGTEDEVLDYTKSLEVFKGCKIQMVEGEDHAFTHNFESLIPSIFEFFQS